MGGKDGGLEYLGFDPSTSSLLRTHASDCANTPLRVLMEYLGFDPSTSCLRSTHASDCANTPMADAGAAVKRRRGKEKKKLKLRHGESNPGHLRDRQRCYQLHHDGRSASSEDRTRDLALTKRMLCQLSYRGLFRLGRLDVRRGPHAARSISGRGAVAMRS